MKNASITGIGFALIAVVLWGTAGTAQSFAKEISPLWIGAFRLVLACLLFHTSCYYYKSRAKKKQPSNEITLENIQKFYWRYIALAGICIGLFNLAFFTGVSLTGVATGSLAAIGSAPIWTGLFQAISTKKPLSKQWWLGTLCAISGGIWMVLIQATSWHINYGGLFICLIAGLCYSIYTITSKRLVSTNSPLTVTTHTFSIAAIIAVCAALLISGAPVVTSAGCWVIFYLAFFTTFIAYLLYTYALKYISAPTGVTLAMLEPITAFFLAIIIVKEPINLLSGVGLCLILLGLTLVLRSEIQKK